MKLAEVALFLLVVVAIKVMRREGNIKMLDFCPGFYRMGSVMFRHSGKDDNDNVVTGKK